MALLGMARGGASCSTTSCFATLAPLAPFALKKASHPPQSPRARHYSYMPKFLLDRMPRLDGQVAIVTGANSGVGYYTALGLAERGAHVVMACRNLDKAASAKTQIATEVAGAQLEVMEIDTASQASVRGFAEAYQQRHERLDLLVNNAGIMATPQAYTEDGFEGQLATNYLGHFALTGLLLPQIEASPAARVVTLSSIAHKNARIHFEDLHFRRKYDAWKAYGQTKLACLVFAYELERRLRAERSDAISVAAHPGVSNTNLGNHLPAYFKALQVVFKLVGHSPERAAEPSLMAAAHPGVKGGDYLGPTGFQEMSGDPWMVNGTSRSRDPEIGQRLWATSEAETGVRYLS